MGWPIRLQEWSMATPGPPSGHTPDWMCYLLLPNPVNYSHDFWSDNFCIKTTSTSKYLIDNVHVLKLLFFPSSFQLQVEGFQKIRLTLEHEENLPSQTERIKMLLIITETWVSKRKTNLVKHCYETFMAENKITVICCFSN